MFYNILNNSSQLSYLLQIGINIMGISTTAFQIKTILKFRKQKHNKIRKILIGNNFIFSVSREFRYQTTRGNQKRCILWSQSISFICA